MIKKKKKKPIWQIYLKSETTTNQEQGKKIEADMTPGCMHSAVRRRRSSGGSVVEQRRFLLSLYACLCVFEDNDTKRQARFMWDVSQRAREFMESSRKRKKKKKVENERAGERKNEGASGIKWK